MIVVKGAVAKPGVYQLPPGSVIATAIVAAGGLAANGSVDSLNLQQPVHQGMTVTIPIRKPAAASPAAAIATAPQKPEPTPAPRATSAALSPIDINSATEAQLQDLPGIGPSLAARILTYRKEVGPFRTPEQLMDVKGITPEKFNEIQALVRTN
jgi:competence protein ComEA